MLTNSEWKWLADRKKDRHFVCRFCPGKEYGREMPDTGGRPCVCHCMSLNIRPWCYRLHWGVGWDDVAEFEARVAAKLANYIETLGWKGCGKHSLKQARLTVEEEMNNEMDK